MENLIFKKLKWVLLFVISYASVGQEKGTINNSNSKHVQLKSTDIGDCKWTTGFWADKFKIAEETMIPYMGTLLKGDIGHGYNNFKIAAGLKEGEHKGFTWHDGDFYKWMEASVYLYAINKDEKIIKELDEIIDVIALAQQSDGYLSTPIIIRDDLQQYENRRNHEMYNSGHLMTSACIHHRVTGKTNFLNIAIKNANLLYDTFIHPDEKLGRFGFNQTQIMGLVELYRTTKDKRYLDLAEVFINNRGKYKISENSATRGYPIGDMVQERVALRDETEAVGHAVLALYFYAGAADVYAETGEEALIKALDRLWDNVVEKKMYVTGALGQTHHGASTRKDPIQEGFIDEYMMPNLTAYNETCANICNAMFNHRMLGIKGDSKYADIMELVLYNSALSGISLTGTEYYYSNPLRKLDGALDYEKMNTEFPERQSYLKCFCCPPNLVRTIVQSSGWAYAKAANGIAVNLYGDNELNTNLLDGSVLKLSQVTEYPWNGDIKITIEECKSDAFDIMLRIPSWASEAKVFINGKEVSNVSTGAFKVINRKWVKGDQIKLQIPMEVAFIEGNNRIEEVRNQIAIKRGPIVYCLESADLPNNTSVMDVYVSADQPFNSTFQPSLLGGITTVTGDILIRDNSNKKDKNEMYSRVSQPKMSTFKGQFVPYYAWSNRGSGEMTVWLPIIWK